VNTTAVGKGRTGVVFRSGSRAIGRDPLRCIRDCRGAGAGAGLRPLDCANCFYDNLNSPYTAMAALRRPLCRASRLALTPPAYAHAGETECE
jgi:hypothetical protein